MDFLNNHQIADAPRINYLDPRLSTYNLQPPIRNDSPTIIPKIDEEKDRQFIDSWLLDKGKFQTHPLYINHPKQKNGITISFAKCSLKNCIAIMDQLNKTQEELKEKVETMSSSEWKQKSLDIAALKDDFDKLMMVFDDNNILISLKGTIKQRAKKRLNQKKRRKFLQEMKKERADKQAAAHKQIDRWLESKKEDSERLKMEEKMKKDADCVLYEVTKKKSDARKQLSLISALVKLRTVRDSMATQRGEKLSIEDRQAFGSVTEKLIRMWENSFQNYCKEEQCLKVMLEDNATKDSRAAQIAKERQVSEEWNSLIFGEKSNNRTHNATYWALTSADRDMETFIAIRKSWDTFLTNNPSGSGIPIGWVLPPSNPSESWLKYSMKKE